MYNDIEFRLLQHLGKIPLHPWQTQLQQWGLVRTSPHAVLLHIFYV